MKANHDRLSKQLRKRLQTTNMGLGLVRLLRDAGRTEEAHTTLASLKQILQARKQSLR